MAEKCWGESMLREEKKRDKSDVQLELAVPFIVLALQFTPFDLA
jgi:hypothetical protein